MRRKNNEPKKSVIRVVEEIRAKHRDKYIEVFGEPEWCGDDFKYITPKDCGEKEMWLRKEAGFYRKLRISLERVWKRYRAELRRGVKATNKRFAREKKERDEKTRPIYDEMAKIDAIIIKATKLKPPEVEQHEEERIAK